jgi:benzoylformate decarboxylase
MQTVRKAAVDVFRANGVPTMLGHPGSIELPILGDSREDLSYVLGLQELAVGMADGCAQVSGRPTQFNLHPACPP